MNDTFEKLSQYSSRNVLNKLSWNFYETDSNVVTMDIYILSVSHFFLVQILYRIKAHARPFMGRRNCCGLAKKNWRRVFRSGKKGMLSIIIDKRLAFRSRAVRYQIPRKTTLVVHLLLSISP